MRRGGRSPSWCPAAGAPTREERSIRVIAGAAKGRRLSAPSGRRTRPTADRVKEALFSILQPTLPGAVVADLYAGSGALAIEALSRGAERAVLVERSGRALSALRDNLTLCGLSERATVIEGDVGRALQRGLPEGPVDIALLDPPYDIDGDVLAEVLGALPRALAPGATVVLEADHHRSGPSWPPGLSGSQSRRYGDTVLHIAAARDPS